MCKILKKIKIVILIFIGILLSGLIFVAYRPPVSSESGLTNINTSGMSSEAEDFSTEVHGTTGLDIDWVDEYHGYGSGWYCDQRVLDGPYGSHTKVLMVRDAQGGANTWSVKWLDNAYDEGSIQFVLWLTKGSRCTSPHYHYLKFRNSANTIAFEFRFDLKTAQTWVKGGSEWQLIATLTNNDWYQYSISFSKSEGTFSVDIEHESTGNPMATISDVSYQNIVSIEEVYIGTNVADYHGNSRWDNFIFTRYTTEKFGVFFYSTDAGHSAGNVINKDKIRGHIANYKNVLLAKGYSEVLVYEDVGSTSELNAHFNEIDALEDEWDAIFFYIWGHGWWNGYDSTVKLNPYIDSNRYDLSSSQFNNLLDALDTNKIGFLVDACFSGGFVLDFGDDPYLAMTSTDTQHASFICWPTGEAYFSNSFWDFAQFWSDNAVICWSWALFWNWIPEPLIYNGLSGFTFF